MDPLLPLHRDRHLQPLRTGVDAGSGRTGQPRRGPGGRDHREAGDRPRGAHHSLRSRVADDRETDRPPARRSRITKSHRRPHVSNDNPYSESHFRTLKYRPDFPKSFGSFEDAHAHCGRFFAWYNEDHRHSGIAFHTPADVHLGRAVQIREQRIEVLGAAYAAHPERFVCKAPEPPALPKVARINQPKEDAPITK